MSDILDLVQVAFMIWTVSEKNKNHARFNEQKYFEYVFCDISKFHLKDNEKGKQCWPNQKHDAL